MNDSNSMTVYMVAMGEKCEGVGTTQLHYSLEGAIATARQWMDDSTVSTGWEWKEMDPRRSRVIREWEGGCDYIEITEEKILK